MKITPAKVNFFNFIKLPLAYLGGVRVQSITDREAIVTIKHKWMNQNPFKSMFWAAQGMAAEMPTGILVMKAIDDSKRKVSMLVTHQEGRFTKKATGKIIFKCVDGSLIKQAIEKSIETGEGQVIHLKIDGVDASGDVVSKFVYEWSIKVKQ